MLENIKKQIETKRDFMFTTGLEPVPEKEQILSLSCLPIPPSERIGIINKVSLCLFFEDLIF